MSNKVYIIIPVFNVEKYLRKCLDSVFSQTYKNIDVICINDGSTDNSLEILNTYDKHSNLTIINQDNKGVSGARNAGLDFLNYNEDSYLTFIDADDWIDSDYVEKLLNIMMFANVDIVCSSFKMTKGDIVTTYKHIKEEKVYDSISATELLIKDETIQSHSVSKLYKTYLWKNIRYNPELFYMEDQDVVYKLFYASKSIFITNYAGYYYRQDNSNAATKKLINNDKIVSGLRGYYSACMFNFKNDDYALLHNASNNALAAAYLMLIPYFKKKNIEKKEDLLFMNELKTYLKDYNVINNYVATNKNCLIKKRLYLICPYLYPCLFRLAKTINSLSNHNK